MGDMAGTEALITDKPQKTMKSSFGVAFALIFCTGFGAAMLYAGHSNSAKTCDRPLFDFLMGFGVTAIFAALVFLGLEMTAKGDGEDDEPKGIGFFCFWIVLILFFAFGITGSVYYWDSDDCDTLAAVAHRWTFAGVLAFLILAFLIASGILGKFGGPLFALFGFLLANLFQWLADLFRELAEALNDDGDPENQPPKRSAAGNFALYVNHTVVIWFFAYILWQVYDEKDDPCDTGLHDNLTVFGTWGCVMAYCDFLYEKFAGVKTRLKMKKFFRFVWAINIIAYIIWGIETATLVIPPTSCKDTAKDVYRLSFLLSCIFFVFCGFLLLGLCAGLLDFLCSGRLRFVVVVETGPPEEDEV
jgi:hypothetical protein